MEFIAASLAGQDLGCSAREVLTDAFQALMLDVREKHQVFWPIVVGNGIDVMNQLVRLKESAKRLLHHQAVLAYIASRCSPRVVRAFDKDIAVSVDHSTTLPASICLHRASGFGNVFWCWVFPSVLVASCKSVRTLFGDLGRCQAVMGDECSASAGAWRCRCWSSHVLIVADWGR